MNEKQNGGASDELRYALAYGDKFDSQLHYHEYYEIAFVADDKQEITVDGKDRTLEKGQAIIIRSFDFHAFTEKSENACVMSVFVPVSTIRSFEVVYGMGKDGCGVKCNTVIIPDEVGEKIIFSAFSRAVTQTECGDKQLRIIVGEVFRAATDDSTGKNVPEKIRVAADEMRNPVNFRSGLKVMRRASGMSGSGLLKQMKRYYNISPRDYLVSIKMNYAYNLVRNSQEDLKIISRKAGYRSFDAFSKAFAEKFGSTPSKMRK